MEPPEWSLLTMRPLYGDKCAPLRRCQKLTACFVQNEWGPCIAEPFVYRWDKGSRLDGLAALHVDDVRIADTGDGLRSF